MIDPPRCAASPMVPALHRVRVPVRPLSATPQFCEIPPGVQHGARPDNGRPGDYRAIARHSQSPAPDRSEEHTSELQSLIRISYAVFCLKKKTKSNTQTHN